MAASRWEKNAWVDAQVRRVDPVRSDMGGGALSTWLEDAGEEILRFASQERPRRRRQFWAPKRLAVVAVLVLGASGAAAAASGVFVNANTHTYNHGWQHVAGGPGENLTGAGTNFDRVMQKESAGAGIVFPATYASWRIREIKFNRQELCRSVPGGGCAEESTGMLNVNLAQDAFCTWVLDWRHAKLSGDAAEARQAASVIAGVLRWKAATDIKYIHGEFSEDFAWMRPYMRAVAADDVSKVDKMIGSQGTSERDEGGSWFWFFDPGFVPAFSKRLERANRAGRAQEAALSKAEGSIYLRYLNRHGS
jgi:hypothetical protein